MKYKKPLIIAEISGNHKQSLKRALKLIKVDYEVLPHVIDPADAMKPDAPILHDYIRTKGLDEPNDQPTNVTERMVSKMGDTEKGFAEADFIVEREFDSKPMHQGYIEPQGCVAEYSEDGQVELWCCTQGPYVYRDRLSAILKIDSSISKSTLL